MSERPTDEAAGKTIGDEKMSHPVHTASSFSTGSDPAGSLLLPGKTCWRSAHADRFAVVVDAAAYFSLVRDALLKARHSVLFIGWEFDTRIRLDPDHPLPDMPDHLGPFLSALVERRRGLDIHVLQWRLGLLGALVRGMRPLELLNWVAKRRFHFRLDSHHPRGASHHQKIVVVDDAIAFCGGIDMTAERWDKQGHDDDDRYRRTPSGRPYRPFHDATAVLSGPAARALGELARERWRRATGETLPAPPRSTANGDDPWPSRLMPQLRDVSVAIARTEPAIEGHPEVREVEALWLAAIGSARRTIYVECQYFAARCVGEALAARLAQPDGPEVVVVTPKHAEGWLAGRVMDDARTRLLQHLKQSDRYQRFRIFAPVTAAHSPIYVHAKVLVVDDHLLRIGSANLNNRSMGLDTECDIAVEAVSGNHMEARIRQAILSIRDSLVAEHLDVEPENVSTTVALNGGSLIKAIETLRRPSGRTLTELAMPELGESRPLLENELLDPERAESSWIALRHFIASRVTGVFRRRKTGG